LPANATRVSHAVFLAAAQCRDAGENKLARRRHSRQLWQTWRGLADGSARRRGAINFCTATKTASRRWLKSRSRGRRSIDEA